MAAALDFEISTQWDGTPLPAGQSIKITLAAAADVCVAGNEGGRPYRGSGLKVSVDAPFFDSPGAPPAPAGGPCPQLWDYEVVEIFFLGANDQYLEVELCPHGQHLVLQLRGRRNIWRDQLPLTFTAATANGRWSGEAHIPLSMIPPGWDRLNAYAIHGADPARVYKSLYPAAPGEFPQPDFHRLQFFRPVDVAALLPAGVPAFSSHWPAENA